MFTSLQSKQNDQTSTTGANKPPQRTASSKTTLKQANPFEIMQRLRSNPGSLTYKDINQLQKTIGNSATSQFIKELQDSQSVYTVKSGDTLGEIAEKYNTTVEAVKNHNNIKDINRIYPGQKLTIPAATSKIQANSTPSRTSGGSSVYMVKSGDTLGEIAEKYHTTVEAIKNLNNIKDINLIYPGQKLIIPNAGKSNDGKSNAEKNNTPKPDKSSPQPDKVQSKVQDKVPDKVQDKNSDSGTINVDVLKDKISSYVEFKYTDKSGKESKKIQLPYQWGGDSGKGKWSVEEMTKNMQKLGLTADDPKLQEKVSANAQVTGIDCSGFVLQVINAATNGLAVQYYKKVFKIPADNVLHWGVSAANMTSSQCSKKITTFSEVRPGDFIRFDGGGHIGIVYEVSGDTIFYAHSSGSKGPHRASVKVSQAGKSGLNLAGEGTFSDWDKGYSAAIKKLFNYICRPDFAAYKQDANSSEQKSQAEKPQAQEPSAPQKDNKPAQKVGKLVYEKGVTEAVVMKYYGDYMDKLQDKVKAYGWQVSFYDPGIDWNTFISKEFTDSTSRESKSLTQYKNQAVSGREGFQGGNWYNARKDVIEYFADPRNFMLSDTDIFQFLSLNGYDKTNQTVQGVKNILKGTELLDYASTFIDAAEAAQVNAYYLASKCRLESGRGTSTLFKGKVAGYEGYHNAYNIGAYTMKKDLEAGMTQSQSINKNGALKAKELGWTSEALAIKGGAKWCKDQYISAGQDTMYGNKFDLVAEGGYASHQYVQNIQASRDEASKYYEAYKSINAIKAGQIFRIPVFKNMPSKPAQLKK